MDVERSGEIHDSLAINTCNANRSLHLFSSAPFTGLST
jgi:hypothetical protein